MKKTAKSKSKKSSQKNSRLKETNSLLKSLVDKEKEILQTEDALVEAMKRFRDLFEQSPIGVGIYDTEGELLIANKAYLDIFGLDSFSKLKDQNLFSGLKMPAKESKNLRSGSVIEYEAEYDFSKINLPTKREGAGHILSTVSPLFREKDTIGYMAQIQDITERKKIAESQRLAQLGRLISDMAHEVNNPLMIISGRAEIALLFDEVKDAKLRDALTIILDQCFFAKDIIQRLLKYSRIGKTEKIPIDVTKTLDLIMNILDHHFKMANITVKREIKKDLPNVLGNEKQLQEVFMNIMRNSADAMPGGGKITVKAYKDKNFLRVDITDTGEGMTKKTIDKIFEPFFTTKSKGTGLGMAVCYTIMQEHGGDLKYKSKIGKGTTAAVLLPLIKKSGS